MSTTFRIWLLLAFACLPAAFVAAQSPLREKQVPQEVRDDFALRFDAAEAVQWHKQGAHYYEVRFRLKGRSWEAVYDQDAHWEATYEEISHSELPEKALAHLNQAYKGLFVHDAHKVSTRRFGIVYEVMVSGTGVHRFLSFDMHGERLSDEEMEVIEAVPDSAAKTAPRLPALFKKSDGR